MSLNKARGLRVVTPDPTVLVYLVHRHVNFVSLQQDLRARQLIYNASLRRKPLVRHQVSNFCVALMHNRPIAYASWDGGLRAAWLLGLLLLCHFRACAFLNSVLLCVAE